MLPSLKNKAAGKDLRILERGCSSGEEPYTLAMMIDEFFGTEKKFWDTKVLATDISNKVLEIAQRGIYRNTDIAPLPPSWKLNYFRKLNETDYAISNQIKNEVIFRRLNLMNQVFPFKKKFHVIFCRNVMIYFNNVQM